MMRHLFVALLIAAAALPFLAACSATVEPGYAYHNDYYGPAPGYYSYYRYPRYHEYRPSSHRPVVEERHDTDIHGSITVER